MDPMKHNPSATAQILQNIADIDAAQWDRCNAVGQLGEAVGQRANEGWREERFGAGGLDQHRPAKEEGRQ